MTRLEAYRILGKMWENATAEQAEAVSMAQNDIEFVDLMPKDMVAVVRCKDCRHRSDEMSNGCYFCNRKMLGLVRPNDFCSYGERRGDG